MKVVKEAESPYDWAVGVACTTCGTRFEINVDDLEEDGFKTSGYFFNDTAICVNKIFTICPECQRYFFYAADTLPWAVVRHVRLAHQAKPY
jgi:hypothetical protein